MNAREQIYNFVDHLNDGLSAKNNLDKDFVMKTCLVLFELPVRYAVENFNNQNLETIKGHWDRIREATEVAVSLTNSATPQGLPFPSNTLSTELDKTGSTTSFDVSAIDEVMDLSYGEQRTYLALGLLYDDTFWKFHPHIHHIFSQKLFTRRKMNERGIAPADQERLTELSSRLGNLQMLTAQENHEKSGTDFAVWIKSRGKGFLDQQLIPATETLWELSSFEAFIDGREKLLRKRLQSLFTKENDSPPSCKVNESNTGLREDVAFVQAGARPGRSVRVRSFGLRRSSCSLLSGVLRSEVLDSGLASNHAR